MFELYHFCQLASRCKNFKFLKNVKFVCSQSPEEIILDLTPAQYGPVGTVHTVITLQMCGFAVWVWGRQNSTQIEHDPLELVN